MVRTRVGYTGGTTENPEYYKLGDHTETLEVVYDPSRISYEELLDIFWRSHTPTLPPYSTQYKSAIFYHGEEQRILAEASRAEYEAEFDAKVYTGIIPAARFYPAEDYHQKYYLQNTPELRAEFEAMYPDINGFVNSTAAARLNGYVAGYGDEAVLRAELEDYGLSEAGKAKLLELTAGGLRPAQPVS